MAVFSDAVHIEVFKVKEWLKVKGYMSESLNHKSMQVSYQRRSSQSKHTQRKTHVENKATEACREPNCFNIGHGIGPPDISRITIFGAFRICF